MELIKVINPANEEVIGQIPSGTSRITMPAHLAECAKPVIHESWAKKAWTNFAKQSMCTWITNKN